MSYISQLLRPTAVAGADLSVNDERAWSSWAPQTAAGMQVTADTALKISTVWACVGLISDCLGMLPTIIYERMANGDRRRAIEHPLYSLLHDQPNANQTAFEFKKMQTAHLLLRGNAYAYIQPGARGFADQLIPLPPDRVTPEPLPDGRLRYKYRPAAGQETTYTDDEIQHLRGLTLDGRTGLGVVSYARETLGTAMAREQYGARFFGNNSRPDGVLKTAGKLSPEGASRMAASWNDAHQGVGKSHRIAVLEEGLEYQAMSFSNKDSQFLELGDATAEDVAGRWFRVPPHMVGLTSKATSWGSGIEQMGIGFVTYTLLPWLTVWEQSISRDLILATTKYFAEFLTDALLKGDLGSRYNAYAIGRNNGWLTVNDILRRENMPQVTGPGGDERLKPLNMVDINAAPPAQAEPTEPADADKSDASGGEDAIMADAAKAEMAGTLIRAGYKHKDVLRAVGLPAMEDWGAPPVTLQSQAALKEPPKSAGANTHYERLLRDAAGRVARKELAALSKAAKRGGDWAAAAAEFYGDHGGYVAETLALPAAAAEGYAAGQARDVIAGGPAVLTPEFVERAVATLVALVQEAV